MPAFIASAPGKVILFGEHAVVYGQPALAIPVLQVQAKAIVSPNPRGQPGSIEISAPLIDLDTNLTDLPNNHPITMVISGVLTALGIGRVPACKIKITSTIPIAAGLGSGAAVSIAIIRAFAAFLGQPLPPEKVSDIAFEVEKIYHGTPSGIDNTVITYSKPIYFKRGNIVEIIQLDSPFTILIADTGKSSPTSLVVGDLREAWQSNPGYYDSLFNSVGVIVDAAREAIENGSIEELGPLMDSNHDLLTKMNVSSPELDQLIEVARRSGASGAKLSGGGRGGNMIALVSEANAEYVAKSLLKSGAKRVIITDVR